MAAKESIFRGDSDSWTMTVPLTKWSAGGKFFFAIKTKGQLAATDLSDSNAAIKKTYDDSYITGTTATTKVYLLPLLPTDTRSATPGKYVAEFQWVSADGLTVQTYDQFQYTVKADVNQRVT